MDYLKAKSTETYHETPSEQVYGRDLKGFNFDLAKRNEILESQYSGQLPTPRKTGTTIVGLLYKDGVILGADTRASGGETVVEKDCVKIHYIAPNMYCCGAGTAADTEAVTDLLSSQLKLLRMQTGKTSRVISAVTRLKQKLHQYQGYISAALIMGGVDTTGAHLYTIAPHGSSDKLPYVTMGSGSLAAMSIFESYYKEDLTEEEGKELVARAIKAGIFNDTGSGSNVNITVIRNNQEVEHYRPYERAASSDKHYSSYQRPQARIPRKGTTEILREKFEKFVSVEELENTTA
eukprot:gb/GECG01005931.1/.p1 GENE.gb/GECG01005931.1/~~gb/GECG01005931.1/.p1  ORF type:complete len:292 (+),score=37.14 gb/GECG01005931.1/:1-876(+)